ncbi:hypothetical protein RHGRI_021661 [Rhododendron griersonianum]|uniref:Mitochondrial intermembrane space import and assembly protein 40 homolog n=1 Tax=Rhododendron griersonianum TaxID=479676 RepID=A0AAV6JL26_9ERIC|nr:hypothetical protein RHGRI_021661 [Rhododendron griersonianum]
MGQVQSDGAATDDRLQQSGAHSSSSSSPPPPPQQASMESLIAEAAAFGNTENGSLDEKAQKALECPCIADLRKGPCGTQFSGAFLCFLKSTAEEKGSDCVHPFVALQSCIKANPNAFAKDVLEDDDDEVKEEEEPAQEYKIIPPEWSTESQRPRQRL